MRWQDHGSAVLSTGEHRIVNDRRSDDDMHDRLHVPAIAMFAESSFRSCASWYP
jgi:hypothetical protein